MPPVDQATAKATRENGNDLPPWVSFDKLSLAFMSSKVPVGGLPFTAIITFSGKDGLKHWVKVIINKE